MLDRFRDQKQGVVDALARLRRVADGLGASTLARRLEHDVSAKFDAERFHLIVVGEFNHGKTALLNALLGAEVLPVGVTPTTTNVHHLVYGEQPAAYVVRDSGDREPIPFEELKQFVAGGARSDESVRRLEVEYPAPLLRDRVVLVDTPGVNDLSLTRAEITSGYIPQADAVLFVLDAGQPVKESERAFLQQQLVGRSRERIVFVVNKADIWTDAEREEALSYVRSRLGDLFAAPPILAVSATADRGGDGGTSGIDALHELLSGMLAEERGRLMLHSALVEGISAATVLARAVQARRRGARLSAEQLTARVEALNRELAGHSGTVEERRLMVREETAAIKSWARRDLDRFCEETLERLPGLLDKVSGGDVQTHLGPFLDDVFCKWARAETEEMGQALEQLAERTAALFREDAVETGEQLGDKLGDSLQPPVIEVDTFLYDVGVFTVLSLGLGVVFANALLGGVLLAAAPALALFTRDRTEALVKSRAQEVAGVVLRDAAGRVAPRLDQMVDDFRERLQAWVVAAGRDPHRELTEVLEQTRREREAGSIDLDADAERCEALQSEVDEVQDQLRAWLKGLEPKTDGGGPA